MFCLVVLVSDGLFAGGAVHREHSHRVTLLRQVVTHGILQLKVKNKVSC